MKIIGNISSETIINMIEGYCNINIRLYYAMLEKISDYGWKWYNGKNFRKYPTWKIWLYKQPQAIKNKIYIELLKLNGDI